jgi:RimJ/RimL family protein N-acetyltransferase
MILGPEDEERFLAYCDRHPDETVWLRVAWSEGDARFAADDAGIAAHDRKGVVHVHRAGPAVIRAAVISGRPIVALAGAPEEIESARRALELGAVARTSREVLMALELDVLALPEILARPEIVVRRAGPGDAALMRDWRARYFREVHGSEPTEEALAELAAHLDAGHVWILEDRGRPVMTFTFSAVFPTLVQLEYGYSPPELRSKSYCRAAVAGALREARAAGVRHAVLNTDEKNLAVQHAVAPLGFRVRGRYWVSLLAASAT